MFSLPIADLPAKDRSGYKRRSPRSGTWSFPACSRSSTAPGPPDTTLAWLVAVRLRSAAVLVALRSAVVARASVGVAFPLPRQGRLLGLGDFAAQCPRPQVPLSTLRAPPRGDTRMTRGRCGWPGLHRTTLSFATPCPHGRSEAPAEPRPRSNVLSCPPLGRRLPGCSGDNRKRPLANPRSQTIETVARDEGDHRPTESRAGHLRAVDF